MESTTLPPSDAHAVPTFRQQIDNLPVYVVTAWRGRYASEGTELEARAIIDREAATMHAEGKAADARTVWMRLADAAGRLREMPPALAAAAALAGLAHGLRPQGFEAPAK